MARLTVSAENAHYLATEDQKPFFMLGDTAWELAHKLTQKEAELYFETRAKQRFNMIWINILPECDCLRIPDERGLFPLIDNDPTRLNPAYFEWFKELLEKAASRGLYVGVLPAWGDKVTPKWGAGPTIFTNPETSNAYGRLVAEQLGQFTNLLWVLGGDRPAKISKGSWSESHAKNIGIDPQSDWIPIWRGMANGIRDVLGKQALMTYHPEGGSVSTSQLIHNEEWLDMNCMQSGHGGGRDTEVWQYIERDLEILPPKPTFDGEPNYEDHPVAPWPTFNPKNGFYDDYDVRRQTWRSVFAGGCGVIYGHHSVWHFASDRAPWINHAKMPWTEAIHRPGAQQMQHLRSFMEEMFASGPLVPDQSLIVTETNNSSEHCRLIRTKDQRHIALYCPHAAPVVLHTSDIESLHPQWFDPRTGKRSTAIGETANGVTKFGKPNDIDWVLELTKKSS
ncbi:MAG TPA: DUF4038 domain-containing protein [Fimbriimonas sp.]|nr:DUF4038 domain-containing protein [Fimbriimonas sp.]